MEKYSLFMDKDSILSICQFFPTWWVDLIQSQSKPEKVILWILANWLWNLHGATKDWNSQHLLKKNKIDTPRIQGQHKVIVGKTVCFGEKQNKKRQIDQYNRIQISEIDPDTTEHAQKELQ